MFEELNLMLPEEAFDGPMQMALDEVLLREVESPTLRIYRWVTPSVSFGYFQKFVDAREAHPLLPLVRRWTGGGMVEHGSDLTFSLMLPRGNAMAKIAPALFYKNLHHSLVEILTEFSKAQITLAGDREILSGPSCFTAPARDDLLCRGRKILGGAQRRSAGALLYQGSLQEMVEEEAQAEISQSLAHALSAAIVSTPLKSSIRGKAILLAESRYASPLWNEAR